MPSSAIYNIHPLFEDVQMGHVFPDGKTFVDCLPQHAADSINKAYLEQKDQPGFNLKRFVLSHFILPVPHSSNYQSDRSKGVEANIERLWQVLTRVPGSETGSMIPLPYPYIVPGGRFGEIYYWDSYFTMLGLQVSGKTEMIENMVRNFSFLLDTFGFIPNGSRSYFLGRSQPPFYSLMVCMLAEAKGNSILLEFLPQMEKEYRFWMRDSDLLSEQDHSKRRVVRMPGGELLNRYWDEQDTPRPESYAADMELLEASSQQPGTLFRNLRAGAESGWDYSYRWFRNESDFSTIHTTDIVPVDLNSLIFQLELTIANAYALKGDQQSSQHYNELANARKAAILQYCWNDSKGFFVDYDRKVQEQKDCLTLAGASPLFLKIASTEQGNKVANILREKFLAPGGLVSTLRITGQQWDAPNGWAPLQWIAISGLENYGHTELAQLIARRWIKLNTDVFNRTGKLMEKYNVVETHLEAGGGEYEGQDGFGWTNGVLLALMKKYR